MRFAPLEEGIFIRRLNRFACLVGWRGGEELAHLPNSGRLRELLVPGRRVLLAPAAPGKRSTQADLTLVSLGSGWVSVDARLPSPLMEEALRQGRLAPFLSVAEMRREVVRGSGRLDFLLRSNGQGCFLEVKSVTLVKEDRALFPDAPTARGRRHLLSLVEALGQGLGAAIAFVVQREDALGFSANDGTDPAFGATLREAAGRGVGVYAFGCRVSPQQIEISTQLPVFL